MEQHKRIRKFIKTTIREFLNEGYIDKDGNIIGVDFKITSDDLMNDDKFISFIYEEFFDYGEEMPEELYKLLSINHKKIYREELLILYDFIGDSKNKSLLDDFIKYDYERFENVILKRVETFPEFQGKTIPFSATFIGKIDEILQGRIIQRFIEELPYKIFIPKNVFISFHYNVQKFILDNKKFFNTKT